MGEKNPDQSATLKVRKYPNRRYYDATNSRHVTLEEIFRLVREGHQIEVIDTASGEDITARVLAQIILDMDSDKLVVFPVGLLHRLIQSNEQVLSDFVERYFSQALQMFLGSRQQFEAQLRQWMGLAGGAIPPSPFLPNAWPPGFWTPPGTREDSAPNFAADPAEPEPDEPPAKGADVADLQAELRHLQEKLALLEGKVGGADAETGSGSNDQEE